ncbi:molybdate transport system permease protein [Litoreibacter ponti]|uniref:Molybdenum transport system permease n=1 Tax=Litoreibacter ponti TaxID=1510457 RepID=A0A2T6BLI5_9RHOB|nr:molybdate ABC transporter permease subunit [Litoreibacter ponti]PTX56943.1 molybdate transport system permease protein [Litoreibacter ponti]
MMGLTPLEWEVIALSLRVALVATVISAPLALWLAYVLARKEFWGKSLLNGLIVLPLVLPPVVTGYALLEAFGTQGLIGGWLADIGIVLAFRWTGAVLAAAVMAFPLMVRAMRIGIEAVDPKLEQAATTLGAPPWRVFATITLPLSLPAIIAGAVLAFAKALGEFGATITFVAAIPGETQTIASAIYAALQVPGGEADALRLVWVSVVIALGAVLLSELLARRVRR